LTAKKTTKVPALANDADAPKRAEYGGSRSADWNDIICRQAVESLWLKHSDSELIDKQIGAALDGLRGIEPKDELEGMMAAQLVAAHNAAMEAYRRAMIPDQTTEGRRENLSHAGKLSRTFATLVEALNRHRGKGQQRMTVEHVHVYPGGKAVVGVVGTSGAGDHAKIEGQPHAARIAHAPQPEMWGSLPNDRAAVPERSDGEWSLQDARWNKPRSSEG
jgi:hypothetical protein